VLVAGHVAASFRRIVQFDDGWIDVLISPPEFTELGAAVGAAWSAAGPADIAEGVPRVERLDSCSAAAKHLHSG